MKRTTTSEYDARKKQFQDKYGKENVYFASSDFVRWASPETAGKWVVPSVASGGSAATAIVAEVKTQMRKELTHILTWLETRAGTAAKAAVDSLLNGDPITLPKLKLIWQNVVYRSKVSVAQPRLARDSTNQPRRLRPDLGGCQQAARSDRPCSDDAGRRQRGPPKVEARRPLRAGAYGM